MKILALATLLSSLSWAVMAETTVPDTPANRLIYARQYMALNPTKPAIARSTGTLTQQKEFQPVFNSLDYAAMDAEGARLMAKLFRVEEIKALVDFQNSTVGRKITLMMPEYQKIMGSYVAEQVRKAYEQNLNPFPNGMPKGTPQAPASATPQGTGIHK